MGGGRHVIILASMPIRFRAIDFRRRVSADISKTSTDMAKDTTGRLHVQVKTGGKRKLSSKLWLERQLNDPYVAQAKRDGYRSRAAYKLLEIVTRAKYGSGNNGHVGR